MRANQPLGPRSNIGIVLDKKNVLHPPLAGVLWDFNPTLDSAMTRFAASLSLLLAVVLFSAAGPAQAQQLTITIKDHKFAPAELKVPANKRLTVTVVNDDSTPEEFESHEMKVEKIIPGKTKAVVRIGPLKPGRYPFFGEFHEKTAQGAVIAE